MLLVLPGVETQVGTVIPVAMKRWVASRSCGEIFTLISESESLNKEKSCRFLSRCGTLCFFRLSAVGSQRTDCGYFRITVGFWRFSQSHKGQISPLGPNEFLQSVNCRWHYISFPGLSRCSGNQREWTLGPGGQGPRTWSPCSRPLLPELTSAILSGFSARRQSVPFQYAALLGPCLRLWAPAFTLLLLGWQHQGDQTQLSCELGSSEKKQHSWLLSFLTAL